MFEKQKEILERVLALNTDGHNEKCRITIMPESIEII